MANPDPGSESLTRIAHRFAEACRFASIHAEKAAESITYEKFVESKANFDEAIREAYEALTEIGERLARRETLYGETAC